MKKVWPINEPRYNFFNESSKYLSLQYEYNKSVLNTLKTFRRKIIENYYIISYRFDPTARLDLERWITRLELLII